MSERVALIPSYEPDDSLLKVVLELLSNSFKVVVVNDGSEKEYDAVFTQLPKEVSYLSYEVNKGKGYALKYGLEFIQNTYKDSFCVVTMDSDGQHKVSDAIKISEVCEKDGGLVLGSRFFSNDVPFKSRLGNFAARTIFSLFTKHKIYDTQTGLRAFDSSLLPLMISIKGNRYEYEMNVLLSCCREGITIKEESIETIYINNNAGTHYHPLKDTLRIFKEVIKFSTSSFIGFLVDYGLFSLLTLIPVSFTNWTLACNIFARVVSASVNFTINYKLVFNNKGKLIYSILKYAGLALFILGCNTSLLWVLTSVAGMNEYLAKFLVEITLFVISWLVQRFFVFKKAKK